MRKTKGSLASFGLVMSIVFCCAGQAYGCWLGSDLGFTSSLRLAAWAWDAGLLDHLFDDDEDPPSGKG
jgi:hypothetical protein